MGQTLYVTKLQAVLASTSIMDEPTNYHHPIACYEGGLRLDGDGALHCDHATAGPDSPRTRTCLNHSVAVLLMELAANL